MMEARKMKVGVIMGGVSSEKEVSIMTGEEMRVSNETEKKKKDKKKRESELENMIFQMMEKSLKKALDVALDDILKEWK